MQRIWILLVALAMASSAAAQNEAAFAGVYAVRRVVTSSTCSSAVVDGVIANVFMMSVEPSAARAQLTVVVAGTRRFPVLRGVFRDGQLALSGSDGEGGSISIALVAHPDGTLVGTETVTLGEGAQTCRIVRRVTASPIAESGRTIHG